MNRFDLEDKITELYTFVDRLNDLSKGVLEHQLSNDDISNIATGLGIMLKLHTEILFETFQKVHRLDQYKE